MFFKKHPKPIFTLKYYGDVNFDLDISNNLSSNNIANIASFIYLLCYKSPICSDIIELLKTHKDNNSSDAIVNAWTTIYLADKNSPMVDPLSAFKKNVK